MTTSFLKHYLLEKERGEEKKKKAFIATVVLTAKYIIPDFIV